MMVNSFCWEFLLQSHAALHGEFLSVLHTLCWLMWGAHLARTCAGLYGEFLLHAQCWFTCGVSLTSPCSFTWGVSLSLTHPVLVYVGSTSCTHLCWFIWGVSLTHPMLASFLGSFSHKVCAGFFMWGISSLQKKKKKYNIKSKQNVHN